MRNESVALAALRRALREDDTPVSTVSLNEAFSGVAELSATRPRCTPDHNQICRHGAVVVPVPQGWRNS
jgi:hypothetical protein